MNVEQTLVAISNTNDNELTISGLEAAKANWAAFYPELELLIGQFVADDTSLTDAQEAIIFFGTLLLAEQKHSPALVKCLQLFSRSDSYLSPLEAIFGDVITELTATIFFNVASGNTQKLCDYIIDEHQAMYCKASAIEAVFAQYEVGAIDEVELGEHVTQWLAKFLTLPSATNRFLISALADYCIMYQMDDFKSQFIELCEKDLFDEDRFKEVEVKAWHSTGVCKLIESGIIQPDFNVVDTLKDWIDNDTDDVKLDGLASEDINDLDSLVSKGGLFDDVLYNENTILENSVPVKSIAAVGRNDSCPCGSGKKYKKCCLR